VICAPGINYSWTREDYSREIGVNNGDGTFTVTSYAPDGTVTSVETLTGLPIEPLFPPLDAIGSLATLLVVDGVVSLTDASNAIREAPAHLVHEAEAWSIPT
jgi:hypothetical protein